MIDLCKYSEIFGKPNTGLHSYRLFNLAIVDVILTLLGGYIISKSYKLNYYNTTIMLFILGILLHKLFCVRTTVDKLLFN